MSDIEIKKLRRLISLLVFVVVVFIILTSASIIHSYIDPKSRSFPQIAQGPKGERGEPAKVDQVQLVNLIKDQVKQEISQNAPPRDGTDGLPGVNGAGINGQNGQHGVSGRDGQNGQSAYDLWVQQGNIGTTVDFLTTLHGENGVDGKTPEIRMNPTTGQAEFRFAGDRLWTVMEGSCLSVRLCGGQ